jgi:hypothetical protein
MTVTIDGTTGVATPGVQNSGDETIAGTLQVGGVATNLYPLVSGSVQTTTSGTAFNFTSIPSWAKRITVMFAGTVHNGNNTVVQLGYGATPTIVSTGYIWTAGITATGNVAGATAYTDGFNVGRTSANQANMGLMVITLLDASTNTWTAGLSGGNAVNPLGAFGGGYVSLSDVLTAVRITTTGGTGVFSAGKVNILYE